MRLSDFILQNMESILQAWEDFARTIETPLPDLNSAGLRNHAEAILRTVARDMQMPQSAIQQLEKSRGERPTPADTTAAQLHAVTRLDAGFTLDQVVAEFRALRASVIRLWLPLQMTGESHDVDDMVRFNEAIDQALSESITSYETAVETTRKMVLGVLGHDLRTPLTAALLGAEVLSRKNRSSQREQKVARQVATSVARAKEIVTDLLDLARANLGSGIPVQKASVDLFPLCLSLIEEIRVTQPDVTVIFQGAKRLKDSLTVREWSKCSPISSPTLTTMGITQSL